MYTCKMTMYSALYIENDHRNSVLCMENCHFNGKQTQKTWKMTMKHGKSLIKNYGSRPTILIGKAQELRLLTGPFPRVNCVITRGYLWDCRGRTVYSLERNTRLATNYVWSYWSSSHDLEMS